MITVDMTIPSQTWDKDTYYQIQAWCIDHIGELHDGWDTSATSDKYFNPRIAFMFARDSDATMFVLRWVK